jgi:CBS domain containing-hemolysin-like protein
MIPLLLFLLGCAAVYLGAIGSAFSALMKLSLRLMAERSDRPESLEAYLDNPIVLFTPVRLLLGVINITAAALFAHVIGIGGLHRLLLIILFGAGFVGVFEFLLPLLIIGRDPERVLEILLPSFNPVARVMRPVTEWTTRMLGKSKRKAQADEAAALAGPVNAAQPAADPQSERDERRLLRSIVDFEETLVREIMTPRPDIVAIREDATIADLLALFREQEYSRFPVFKESLDSIAGFVFVKDLVALDRRSDDQPIRPLLRSAMVVPESKRVPELLKQFQRQRAQIAIVVDEYGGTAGLVTIEDMLEEIVGEIRDEYDVEAEPIVEEGNGRYVFMGNVSIDDVSNRLEVEIDRDEGFETLGGYLMTHLGRVPAIGEHINVDGLHVEVLDVQRRRVNKVRITRHAQLETAGSERQA